MEWLDETVSDYRCIKCHNNVAIVRKVNLKKGILPELLVRGGGAYRFVTCSLCGYTEMYDLSIYATNPAPKAVENESAGLAPGT
jgi:predicted nucleic-acid-binding Zn-ribbon protein